MVGRCGRFSPPSTKSPWRLPRSRKCTGPSCTTAESSRSKVQRPDIAKVVQADLDIIKNLAQLIERRIPQLAVYRPLTLAREFERTIKRELDFSRERRTIERCRLQFADEPSVHIPLTFPDLCTSRVLAMEFIEGVAINDLERIRLMGLRPEKSPCTRCADPAQTDLRVRLLPCRSRIPDNLRVLPSGRDRPARLWHFRASRPAERASESPGS